MVVKNWSPDESNILETCLIGWEKGGKEKGKTGNQKTEEKPPGRWKSATLY